MSTLLLYYIYTANTTALDVAYGIGQKGRRQGNQR